MRTFQLTLLMCSLLALFSCTKDPTPATGSTNSTPPPVISVPPPVDNDNLLLGNPTKATADVNQKDNYLLDHTYFIESYNNSKGIPNWVSWHLQAEDIGNIAKQNNFRADSLLSSSFYQVLSTDYSRSSFDHGQNCPAKDRSSTAIANSSTFLMTNVVPQAPMFNKGAWQGLEEYTRKNLVKDSSEAYIIVGNIGSGGVDSSGTTIQTIDNGHITVPKKIWKVIVVLPKGNSDINRIDTSAVVVAVNMPNDNHLYTTTAAGFRVWRNYLTSISAIETEAASEGQTLNLLSNIPATVRDYLKKKVYH